MCGWNNLCRPGVAPWSTSHPVILKVSALGYPPHLRFGAIGPLGLHKSGRTLEFQLHPHCLALELIGGKYRALKIFPNYSAVCGWLHYQPEETMLPPSQLWMDGWRVCLNFTIDFADYCVVNDPLTFWIFLFCLVRCVWIIFVVIVSPSLMCLNYLEIIPPILVCLNFSRIVIILFSFIFARLEFSVLVIFVLRFGSKLPCQFPLLFYFLVDPVPFCFSWTPCHFFSCFAWYNPIRWHLKLLARALVLDVCFL